MKILTVTLTISFGLLMTLAIQEKSSPQLIRIQSRGGTLLDSDILLPYSIIQSIQQQQQQSKHTFSHVHTKIRAFITPKSRKPESLYAPRKPYARQSRHFFSSLMAASAVSSKLPNNHEPKGKLHFERDHSNAKNFKLYDDDGEYLVDLRELSQKPIITNVTTSYRRESARAGSRSPKRLVKHIWIKV